MVVLTIRKRTAGLGLVLILALMILGITSYTVAKHPNMDNWKKEKIVIDRVKTDKKVVALTFDDGPEPKFTPMVLDVLKNHDARATFFIIGKKAESNPQILKRMAAEGHEIGNHSYRHPDFNKLKKDAQLEEINKTTSIIKRLSGQNPVLLRPPGGYLSYDLVEMTKKQNLTIAYWTYQQDSKDWRNGTKPSTIAGHIIKNIQPGQIIILHDGCPNGGATARAVDMIITQLKEDGYTFVTMSELIKMGK
ncbi:MAG TPA: polysaccharide deacetylase family protein [Gelria sp.]|jgi:peptidoglycan/xylan/chitin deacetylase (PgdA/CDA1 family)|nr:polysaccharide deacetylase family protein [Gelria sp.]